MRAQTALEQAVDPREVLARQGLRLPALTLKHLRNTGIYCQPSISIEHQHLAGRYVLRGVESGGAVADIGAYLSYVGEHGESLSWLQRIDSVGLNGVHAIVIAPVLVRVEMIHLRSPHHKAPPHRLCIRTATKVTKRDRLLWPAWKP
jgi:hypothetical protein